MIELRWVVNSINEKTLQFREWPPGMLEASRLGATNAEPQWQDVPEVNILNV